MAEDANEPIDTEQQDAPPPADSDGGAVSQGDIDALLKQAADPGDAEAAAEPTDEPAVEAAAEPTDEPAVEAAAEPTDEPAVEAAAEPPQESAAPEPQDAPAAPAADANGGVSQSDIDALLKAASGDDAEAASADAAPSPPADQPQEAPAAEAEQDVDGLISQDALDKLIAEAQSTAGEIKEATASAVPDDSAAPPPAGAEPMALEGVNEEAGGQSVASVDLLQDVSMRVKIELGRSRMYVEDVLRLGKGSVVKLDKLAGDPVDVFVNERLVAHGEVLVLNDNFCVRINEICASQSAS